MEKMIVLKSSDEETFEVEEVVAMKSQTLKQMIEDNCTNTAILVANVASKTLAKVIEYYKCHFYASKCIDADELKKFDDDFVKVDQVMLFDLIMAANYLNISSLLNLSCQTMANMMKGKTPKKIRAIFGIKNDFTPEEEEEVRRENAWAFD